MSALTPMLDQLAECEALPEGWYGGRHNEGTRTTAAASATARAVIAELMRDGHECRVYPSVDGGVRFEWFTEDAPRPASITWRGVAGVSIVHVEDDGTIWTDQDP